MEHYEVIGERLLRVLAQEGRYPELDILMNEGRRGQRAWVERVFGPFLPQGDAERERLVAQLIALCDVYMWKLLHLDNGLSREQTELALNEMLTALLENRM
jgi:hypothetical protein